MLKCQFHAFGARQVKAPNDQGHESLSRGWNGSGMRSGDDSSGFAVMRQSLIHRDGDELKRKKNDEKERENPSFLKKQRLWHHFSKTAFNTPSS
jgi:hypothetical protein